jgi:hypothetical protein
MALKSELALFDIVKKLPIDIWILITHYSREDWRLRFTPVTYEIRLKVFCIRRSHGCRLFADIRFGLECRRCYRYTLLMENAWRNPILDPDGLPRLAYGYGRRKKRSPPKPTHATHPRSRR